MLLNIEPIAIIHTKSVPPGFSGTEGGGGGGGGGFNQSLVMKRIINNINVKVAKVGEPTGPLHSQPTKLPVQEDLPFDVDLPLQPFKLQDCGGPHVSGWGKQLHPTKLLVHFAYCTLPRPLNDPLQPFLSQDCGELHVDGVGVQSQPTKLPVHLPFLTLPRPLKDPLQPFMSQD